MRHIDNQLRKNRELHPRVGVGLFFIVLGLALLVATNDMLNIGSVKNYFTWETAMVFVGFLLLLNFQFIGGLLLIAAGGWFMMDHYYSNIPDIIRTIYWPAVIMLLGIVFIISSFIKRRKVQ
jgi:hypothetical protein